MNNVLHPSDDVDGLVLLLLLFLKWREGERGLANIKDSVEASIQWLKNFMKRA